MTREEAKQLIFKASKDDTSSPKNCIHLLTLLYYLNKIFDEHGEQLQDKDDEIELLKHRVEELMKPKTCDGCKYQNIDIDRCDFCKRYYSDQYELKANQ